MQRPPLASVDTMDGVPGLETPSELYTVLTSPARLAGMPHPTPQAPWAALAESGFQNVVCLTNAVPSYDPTPLRLLHAVELQDLYGGLNPLDPERERREIELAALTALEALERGEGVLVHCAGGTGRTGTVIGVILRHLGYSAREVADYLDTVHKARRKDGWPESAWQSKLLETIVKST
ncbi:MAG: tyrosine-protein phosphatase [Candidatus Bipolaricaulota bacterium]|nr:tyrosine-protein phosphatase [Candidatus Bipolaricaulota bacterium]